jgi:subtilisin family serine protease
MQFSAYADTGLDANTPASVDLSNNNTENDNQGTQGTILGNGTSGVQNSAGTDALSNDTINGSSAAQVDAADKQNVTGTIRNVLIKYKKDRQGIDEIIKENKILSYRKLKIKDVYLAQVDTKDIDELKKDENIKYIEEDSIITKLDDTITWNIQRVQSPQVQEKGYSGSGIKVAVLDTGIDTSNTDLQVAGGVSYVDGVTSYNDDNGHGTAVAGVLAALNNGEGLIGTAPEVGLYSVKVLDSNGTLMK